MSLLIYFPAAEAQAAPGPGAPVQESVAATLIDDARDAWGGQNWEKVAEIGPQLVAENPYNGKFWYQLATAYYYLKNYEASIDAYQHAVGLGQSVPTSLYNMACDYALLGETEKAIETLERAIRKGLKQREQLIRNDTDLASIRDTQAFRERVLPKLSDNVSRVVGWRADLEYLTKRMEETHYDVYRNISRDEWHGTINRLSRDIPKLEDHEVIVRLMQLVTRVGDGHTSVRPPREGPYAFHALPAHFYVFKDGVFVRDAAEEYAAAVGKRVVRVGKLPVDEVLERVATVTQRDNAMQVKWLAPMIMTRVEVLESLDIIDGLGHVDVVVEDEAGDRETVRFEPVSSSQARSIFRGEVPGLVTMRDTATELEPLWQKDFRNNYWFEYLEDERLVYFQYNSVRNKEDGESIADFSTRLFQFIEANEVDALVIDVRLNHGGNNFLNKPILHGIIQSDKINQRGRLFTVIGRGTFSACQNFCNRLAPNSETIFVGEPTSSRPNFVGEGNQIVLPYSGITVNGSSRYWQDSFSDDYRQWIAPELVAEMSSMDFKTNRDPAMDAIRAYLANRKASGERAAR